MSLIGRAAHTVLEHAKTAVFEKGTLIYRLNIPSLRRSTRKLASAPRMDGPVRIGFVLQPPTSWAVIESVYRAAAADPETEPVVVLMPELEFRAYVKLEKILWEETYAFGEKAVPAEHRVQAYNPESGEWLDPASLNLDFVFLPRPYETYLPAGWRASALRKVTRVCYVPYAPVALDDTNVLYNTHFIRNVNLLFAENTIALGYLNGKLAPTLKTGEQKIFDTGYPKYDLVQSSPDRSGSVWPQPRGEESFRVIWTPRWTSSARLGGNNFRRYHEKMIALAEQDPSLQLVFRPHPLALDAYVREGVATKEELDAYLRRYDACPRAAVDRSVAYYDTFFESDVLVADFTSLIEDYLITGKPVVFCTPELEGLQEYTDDMVRPALYTVHHFEQLSETLDALRRGEDPKKEIREMVSARLRRDGHIGQDILGILKSEARR